MIDAWIGHHHCRPENPVSRLPAGPKLALALVIIPGTVMCPARWIGWFVGVGLLLVLTAWLSRIPPLFLLKRLALLSPLVLGAALVNALQPGARGTWWETGLKSFLCLATVILLANTTPFSRILRVLKSAHVPGLLVTTLALMHRYLFVLADEAERMRRARASRTFTRRHGVRWRALAAVVSQLFIRASERAER